MHIIRVRGNLEKYEYTIELEERKSHRYKLCFYTLGMNHLRRKKKTIPFTIVSKRIKYLGINLTKEVKAQYSENIDEVEDDTKNGKKTHALGLEELIPLK